PPASSATNEPRRNPRGRATSFLGTNYRDKNNPSWPSPHNSWVIGGVRLSAFGGARRWGRSRPTVAQRRDTGRAPPVSQFSDPSRWAVHRMGFSAPGVKD